MTDAPIVALKPARADGVQEKTVRIFANLFCQERTNDCQLLLLNWVVFYILLITRIFMCADKTFEATQN